MSNFIKFLGTAGSRFVVATQLRASAGIFIKYQDVKVIIDPGPGTIVHCAKSRPKVELTSLDAVILTHSHIDHSNDVNVLIDAMTAGGLKRRGLLFAPADCIKGENAVVLNYLRNYVDEIIILEPEQEYNIKGKLKFKTSIRHIHPVETYGLLFDFGGNLRCSFLTDTKYFPELIECYKPTDILILNVVRYVPLEKKDKSDGTATVATDEIQHLCIADVSKLIAGIKPTKRAILTHLGMTMLKAKPTEIAAKLTAELGIEVIAATDGMMVNIDSDEETKAKRKDKTRGKSLTLFDYTTEN